MRLQRAWLFALMVTGACSSEPRPSAVPSGSRDAAPAVGKDAPPANVAAPGPDGPAAPAPDAGGVDASAPAFDASTSNGADVRADAAEAGATADASAPSGVVKLMVMGSSNETSTCWRAFLWQKLRAAGVTNFDFVGGQKDGPDCGVPGYDRDDESRPGTIVSGITAAQYASRFRANPPDIVLVHFGGADILQGIAPSRVIPGYTLMVEEGRKVNSSIRFLVGEHTPMTPSSCPRCPVTVPELNAATVAWAKTITTPQSPVTTVDLFNGLDPATDTSDRVHLNDMGSQKVAQKWVDALLPIFKP
jgi:hypothetical protein